MRCGFHAGRVDWTRLTVKVETSRVKTCLDIYLDRLVGSWSLALFPECRALFFLPVLFAAFCGVHAKNEKERQHPFAVPVALDPRVDPAALTRWLLLPPRRAS